MRQEIRHLPHQVGPEVIVLHPRMHVHSADHHPPADSLQIADEIPVPLLVGNQKPIVVGEGMRRSRDGRQPEFVRGRRYFAAQPGEIGTGFPYRGTGSGADFHLRPEELRAYLVAEPVGAFLHERFRRVSCQPAIRGINEKILLFDTNAEARLGDSHESSLYRH